MQFVIYIAGVNGGGWAYDIYNENGDVVRTENGRRYDSRYCENDVTAALCAISWGMKQGCNDFIVVTSRKYLVDAVMKWRWFWKKNNWTTKEGQVLEAKDMWKIIDVVMQKTNVEWCFDNDSRLHRLRTLAKQGK